MANSDKRKERRMATTSTRTEAEINMLNSSATNNNSKFALTTKDNPYDPFTQFGEWLMFDNQMGYGSASYLARIAKTSESLSSYENDIEIERAIDEILKFDILGIYKKVENKNLKSK